MRDRRRHDDTTSILKSRFICTLFLASFLVYTYVRTHALSPPKLLGVQTSDLVRLITTPSECHERFYHVTIKE